jgi:hypothetical protein
LGKLLSYKPKPESGSSSSQKDDSLEIKNMKDRASTSQSTSNKSNKQDKNPLISSPKSTSDNTGAEDSTLSNKGVRSGEKTPEEFEEVFKKPMKSTSTPKQRSILRSDTFIPWGGKISIHGKIVHLQNTCNFDNVLQVR